MSYENYFDAKTIMHLQYYVYMLIDPRDSRPFYIGKGVGNRVFEHLNCALKDTDISNSKYDIIRSIVALDKKVEHVIVRHGLSESEAYIVESSLIDSFEYCGYPLSNEVKGHHSLENGLKTVDEVIRWYNAEPLEYLGSDCIIININKKYHRAIGEDAVYKSTKETWIIAESRLPNIHYVLSEYKGIIVEVFKVNEWYPRERGYLPTSKNYGKTRIGYGFNGVVADDEVRNKYINKSIAHTKKRGQANPVTFKI